MQLKDGSYLYIHSVSLYPLFGGIETIGIENDQRLMIVNSYYFVVIIVVVVVVVVVVVLVLVLVVRYTPASFLLILLSWNYLSPVVFLDVVNVFRLEFNF